ncbi:protein FAR1-RELATED SEQUENCE 5-like [Tasmannia lanceolata]|uniref:protein FAR1-RELATED SEQUENCE 5-like n=1 Tax=Tasmannia lanceolata TaxID=3420 RepID=UPI00406388DC
MGSKDDMTDDGMAMDVEPCASEANEMEANSVRNELTESEEVAGPYLGMQFDSDEAARAWYNDYARRLGFSIRIGRNERSQRTKEIISRQFLCSKEGSRDKRYIDRKDRVRPERPLTRVGCKAMIMVKKRGPNKWVVTRFEKLHSHELVTPDKVPFLRSHRLALNTIFGPHMSTFDKVLDNHHDEECETICVKPVVKTQLPMEEQVAELYTKTMFLIFQEELCASLRYIAIKTNEDGELSTYKVTKFGEDNNRSQTVVLNVSETRASCTCRMFEFIRILCRHALIVFRLTNVLMLPSHYIVERYTRSPESGIINFNSGTIVQVDCRESLTLRYTDLCQRAIKYAEEGATSLDAYNVAVCALQRSLEEVLSVKKSVMANTQQCTPFSGSIQDDNIGGGSQADYSTNQKTLHNCQSTTSNWCPDNSVMKHNLENCPKDKRARTICGLHGHESCACFALKDLGGCSEVVPQGAHSDIHVSTSILELGETEQNSSRNS